ncbi:MAG: hypothetical protein GXP31_19590 [Kiritimatiellaeota bacterium]|nr:hypothetical protein [Kiritimatiellota bacterium]
MRCRRYETACEYTRELAKLKLWYAWRLWKHEDVDFETAITKRVGLVRMSVFWGDDPRTGPRDADGWNAVLDKLRELYERHENDSTSARIEAEGLALLWPHLEPMIERDLEVTARWLADAVGCFQYEFRPFYAEPDSEDHLTLHVRNAYQPDSPFRHFPEMVADLLEIVSRARRERPDVSMAQCATWLNSLPPFANLFPPSWVETAQPGIPGNHSGWWGQFMDRRGGFHAANAQRFRRTGRFPFRHLLCRCSIPELRRHLEQLATPVRHSEEQASLPEKTGDPCRSNLATRILPAAPANRTFR